MLAVGDASDGANARLCTRLSAWLHAHIPQHAACPAPASAPIPLHRQRLTGSQVRMRGEAVTLTAEHDDGEHDHGDHREHDGGEHGDGDTVTAHREPQKPPPIPRLRWPPNGCGVATAAHNDA